jgi:hypothetical protein
VRCTISFVDWWYSPALSPSNHNWFSTEANDVKIGGKEPEVSMQSVDNKEIVGRQWYEQLWDSWNVDTADELFTSDYRLHLPGNPAPMNREATKQIVTMFSAGALDREEILTEGSLFPELVSAA